VLLLALCEDWSCAMTGFVRGTGLLGVYEDWAGGLSGLCEDWACARTYKSYVRV
jgi:hypothetical protein